MSYVKSKKEKKKKIRRISNGTLDKVVFVSRALLLTICLPFDIAGDSADIVVTHIFACNFTVRDAIRPTTVRPRSSLKLYDTLLLLFSYLVVL